MKSHPRPKQSAQRIWERQWTYCWICGAQYRSGDGALETHHIVPTGMCPRGRDVPTNWFRACGRYKRGCHFLIESTPLVVPAAIKSMINPDAFDLPMLLDLAGRASGAVTDDEVNAVIARLERNGFVDATPERAVNLIGAEIRRALNA